MLKGKLIHPEIMAALSLCGHGDKILIADGNYPLASKSGGAEKIYLGYTSGCPSVTDVLSVLVDVINFEMAEVMQPDEGAVPEIFQEFESTLEGVGLKGLSRSEFYDACCLPGVRLAISTGEQRTFANILLTIGVTKSVSPNI